MVGAKFYGIFTFINYIQHFVKFITILLKILVIITLSKLVDYTNDE